MKVHSDDEGSAILDPWMTRCKDARGFLLLQRGGEEGGHRPSGERKAAVQPPCCMPRGGGRRMSISSCLLLAYEARRCPRGEVRVNEDGKR